MYTKTNRFDTIGEESIRPIMKRDRTQQRLDQLRAARLAPASNDSVRTLAAALEDPSNYVVAKAAEIVEQGLVAGLEPDLLTAFHRILGPERDRGCEAATAIAKALYALDYREPEPYLRGIRHRQLEASFGPPVDVATTLRGVCALALVQTPYDRTLDELARLLTDEYAPPRLSAARALGCTGFADGCIPLLMFKVYTGDTEFEVIAECMASMLALSVPRSLAFVADQLDSSDPDRSEAAAIALGAVRDERAFETLRIKWDSTAFGPIRERILQAMAASRSDKAVEFLTGLIAEEPARTAALAMHALAMHRRDERIRSLVQDAMKKRENVKDLEAVFSSSFGNLGTV